MKIDPHSASFAHLPIDGGEERHEFAGLGALPVPPQALR